MIIIDISVPISAALPTYPGDPPVIVSSLPQSGDGEPFRISRLCFGTHTGTHIDAPAHLLPDGMPVDQIPLELLIGSCLVVDLADHDGEIDVGLLKKLPLMGETRLLFRTRNSNLWALPGFVEDFTALTPAAATWLVDSGVRLVGIDYLSVEREQSQGKVHRTLLEAGVVILEGLDLSGVKRGKYELICLPLKLRDADGAPCRAVLRGRQTLPQEPEHHTRWPL